MKFEKLSLDKFAAAKIDGANIFGGTGAAGQGLGDGDAPRTTLTAPNGGCVCDTPGGHFNTPGGGFDYNSDTDAYNADGSRSGSEYHI